MPQVKSSTVHLTEIYSGSAADSGSRDADILLAMKATEEVVYGIWTFDHLVKVGYSANLRKRMTSYGITRKQFYRLLFVVPGTLEDEQCIHAVLRPHRARGREYYHPSGQVMEFVNDMRAEYGITPIAA